jgi:arginine N-succinyltransferase
MSSASWVFDELLGADGLQALRLQDPAGATLAELKIAHDIGLQEPRAWYHVGCVVHAARPLRLFQRRRTLQLGNDLTGASELAAISWRREGLDQASQAELLGRLLKEAVRRVAAERPGQALIVELAGLRDAQGQAPFWQGLGRHFYAGDASQRGGSWRSWVAALLPRQPVYACFLPDAAQAAIGTMDN